MLVFLVIFGFIYKPILGLNNGLALTPPMGWMSWLRYKCNVNCEMRPDECISERLFRKVADIISSQGYLSVGYEYIIIDDCWMGTRNNISKRLDPDSKRFPQGIRRLADYIHSKGLQFGIYQNLGKYTCAGYTGMKHYLEIDAQTFAEWKVDYVKVDGCHLNIKDYAKDYVKFGTYLNKTGRPIVYSCSWPFYMELRNIVPDYKKISETCNLWRNYYDIEDSYKSVLNIINWYGQRQSTFMHYVKPGGWSDPDMLIIGNAGLDTKQSRLQMAIWAILAAPMLMSVDLSTVRPEYKKILQNRDVIEINQDILGIPGTLVNRFDEINMWIKPITPVIKTMHSMAVAFHNRYLEDYKILLSIEKIGLPTECPYTQKNIFEPQLGRRLLSVNEGFIVSVEAMGVVLYKFTPKC